MNPQGDCEKGGLIQKTVVCGCTKMEGRAGGSGDEDVELLCGSAVRRSERQSRLDVVEIKSERPD